MLCSLILNFNDFKTTKALVKILDGYSSIHKIIVVDNCSTDNSYLELLKIKTDKVDVIQTKRNGGYGFGNNYGIKYISKRYHARYILLCNPDIVIEEEPIISMIDFLNKHEDYILVAPLMLNRYKEKQYNTAFKIPSIYEYILSLDIFFTKITKSSFYKNFDAINSEYKQVDALSGSLFMMKTDEMIKYGMYDEKLFLYCEEIVLAMKLKAVGLKTALLVKEQFIHMHSVSISKTYHSLIKKRQLLLKSKLYVIKKYYDVNYIEYFLAILLSKISLFEIALLSLIKDGYKIIKDRK